MLMEIVESGHTIKPNATQTQVGRGARQGLSGTDRRVSGRNGCDNLCAPVCARAQIYCHFMCRLIVLNIVEINSMVSPRWAISESIFIPDIHICWRSCLYAMHIRADCSGSYASDERTLESARAAGTWAISIGKAIGLDLNEHIDVERGESMLAKNQTEWSEYKK